MGLFALVQTIVTVLIYGIFQFGSRHQEGNFIVCQVSLWRMMISIKTILLRVIAKSLVVKY